MNNDNIRSPANTASELRKMWKRTKPIGGTGIYMEPADHTQNDKCVCEDCRLESEWQSGSG